MLSIAFALVFSLSKLETVISGFVSDHARLTYLGIEEIPGALMVVVKYISLMQR